MLSMLSILGKGLFRFILECHSSPQKYSYLALQAQLEVKVARQWVVWPAGDEALQAVDLVLQAENEVLQAVDAVLQAVDAVMQAVRVATQAVMELVQAVEQASQAAE